jgi:hypothetical protein
MATKWLGEAGGVSRKIVRVASGDSDMVVLLLKVLTCHVVYGHSEPSLRHSNPALHLKATCTKVRPKLLNGDDGTKEILRCAASEDTEAPPLPQVSQ